MGQVPRILHLTWKSKTQLRPKMRVNLERWRALMPHWHIQLYDDADLEALVAKQRPHLLKAYRGFAKQIERVDFARPIMLATHGGVYADMDVEPLKSFDPWCDQDADVVLAMEPPEHYFDGEPLISNAVMLSKQNTGASAFWDGYMDYMVKHYVAGKNPVENTGPQALARYVASAPESLKRSRLRILGPCEFNAATDTAAKPHLPPISKGCKPEQAYATHQWLHTWLEKPSTTSFNWILCLVLFATLVLFGLALYANIRV